MGKISINGIDFYQIEKGDDYFKIGKKLYEKYSAASLIAEANPDFEFLKTGAVIALPEFVPDEGGLPEGNLEASRIPELEINKKMDALEGVEA